MVFFQGNEEMIFTKFILIDSALTIVGFFLFLMLKRRDNIQSSFGNFSSSKLGEEKSIRLPLLEELLEKEISAKKDGSGIKFGPLIGLWKFESVWKKGTDDKDLLSSSLLRLFNASLELSKNETDKEILKFDIINSIQFGALEIRFVGSGELKGVQPLLPFFFERIELNLGTNSLFSRSLQIPIQKDRPFFALIALNERDQWLAARGRGGGLALWSKTSP